VLHRGVWAGHEVLVQSALPTWARRVTGDDAPRRLAAAMAELARGFGVEHVRLASSAYWAGLQQRIAAVADRPDGAELATAAAALVEARGDVELELGAWHGDWAPWNTAVLADTVLVWDWERFTTGVPVGFDAVHHELQARVVAPGGPDPAVELDATLARAATLLAPFGVGPDESEVTALVYLVDLAARYLTDRQADAGARLGNLGTWLLPVLVRRIGAGS
jgi:hypothetical protein